MRLLNARRLTGPNLYLPGPAAIAEVAFTPDEDPAAALAVWRAAATAGLTALGWPNELFVRAYGDPEGRPHADLVFAAPIDGLDLAVDIAAHNPNTYDVVINQMTVQCTLAEQDLGVVRDDTRRVLPAGQAVPMQANFRVPWTGLPGLLLSAVASDQIPYRLEGVAIVEDGSYEVDYSYEGYVSRQVFLGAATRAVAPILPGGIDIRVGP